MTSRSLVLSVVDCCEDKNCHLMKKKKKTNSRDLFSARCESNFDSKSLYTILPVINTRR